MSKVRLCLVEHAAKTLSVPLEYLDSKLRLSRAVTLREGVALCDFLVAAKLMGVGKQIAEVVWLGRDWLMSEKEIREIYGHDQAACEKISGGPVFETVHGRVYQVAPFIRFLVLEPGEKDEILEGKTRGKIQNKRLRK